MRFVVRKEIKIRKKTPTTKTKDREIDLGVDR